MCIRQSVEWHFIYRASIIVIYFQIIFSSSCLCVLNFSRFFFLFSMWNLREISQIFFFYFPFLIQIVPKPVKVTKYRKPLRSRKYPMYVVWPRELRSESFFFFFDRSDLSLAYDCFRCNAKYNSTFEWEYIWNTPKGLTFFFFFLKK